MSDADRNAYPPVSRFHAGVGEADLFAAIRRSNDDPIPRRLAVALKLLDSPPADDEADFARLQREVGFVAPFVESDREVMQLHCSMSERQRPLPAMRLRHLVSSLSGQFHFSGAAEREFEVETGNRTVTPEAIGILASSGFNRIVISAEHLACPNLRAARLEGFRSITVRLSVSAARPSIVALLSMLDFVLELQPDRVIVPGNPPDLRIDSDDPDRIRERFDRAGYHFIGPDCFALPHDDLALALQADRLQFGLLGCTPQWDCDLLGFGASAISQVGDCLSQNTESLAGWRRAIDAGRLPTARGYRLTADDELRADLVQQLVCRRRIAIDGIERDYGIDFRRYFAAELARLAPYFAIGLARDRGDRIEVGSRAWPWLRSIALCFHASDDRGSLPREAGIRH